MEFRDRTVQVELAEGMGSKRAGGSEKGSLGHRDSRGTLTMLKSSRSLSSLSVPTGAILWGWFILWRWGTRLG